ncbi:DNA cytosine methyltransferase [Phocaeicola sp.]
MTHASLFSGIGGFDIAAEIIGWKNLFWCEVDSFCQTVLKYYFPNAEGYSNIYDADFSRWYGKVSVLSGGFPCQPFSQAGKRKGTADKRYLWPAMLGAIRQIKPRWVVGENVYGIINWNAGMVFDQVCVDLENEGYEVQPFVLPACGVNAPHQRYRTFFIAYSYGRSNLRKSGEYEGKDDKERLSEWDKIWKFIKSGQVWEYPGTASDEDVANAECVRGNKVCTDLQFQKPNGERVGYNGGKRDVADAYDTGGLTSGSRIITNRQKDNPKWQDAFIEPCGYGQPFVRGFEAGNSITDWLDFPTQSPVCRGDDGVSALLDSDAIFSGVRKSPRAKAFNRWRQEAVKTYGNAVVPPLVLQIYKAIDIYEQFGSNLKK